MDVFPELLNREAVRGERIAWVFRWVMYGLSGLLSGVVFLVQGYPIGRVGLILCLGPLLYNAVLAPAVLGGRTARWLRYLSVAVDVAAVTAYNAAETSLAAGVTPMTVATLLLYPIIIFLASLRLDRWLIAWAAALSVAGMDGLWWAASGRFEAPVLALVPSLDAMSQVYRTIYLLVAGGLMMFVPGTIRRLLRAQQQLFLEGQSHWERAHRDPLTGLANRLTLEEQLPRLLKAHRSGAPKVGLVYLDLDEFKPINDRHGHDAGDFVLSEVGRRLAHMVRDGDLAVRLGGDEFVIVLPAVEGAPTLESLIDRLRRSVTQPIAWGGRTVAVGVTFGSAVYPDDADDAPGLIEVADRRMLALKGGRR